MSKICKEAIDWALRCIDYDAFRSLMQANPQFRKQVSKGGFKIQRQTFGNARVREHLKSRIAQDEASKNAFFTEGVVRGKRLRALPEIYRLLPQEWLKENWGRWFRTLKDPRPWGCLLFCDMEHSWAQDAGTRLLAMPSFWANSPLPLRPRRELTAPPPALPAPMAGNWALEVRPDAQGATAPAAAAAEQPDASEEASAGDAVGATPSAVPELSPLVSAAQEQPNKHRLGAVTQERDQLAKQLKILKEVHAKELAAKDAEIQELQRRLDECDRNFAGAVEELRASQERTLQTQMAAFETTLLGVHPDLRKYAAKAADEGKRLQERVTQLLAKQRETNKRYGTFQSIRDELRRTDQMLTQVKQAVDEAISPVEGITRLQSDLESRIEELKSKLRGDLGFELQNGAKVLPARLTAYITEITCGADGSLEKFEEVRKFLESPMGRQLYSHEERAEAAETLERCRARAVQGHEARARLPESTMDEPITGNLRNIFHFSNFLDRFAELDLFVDAYNVIKRDPLWASMETTTNGFQAARNDFIEHCRRKARLFRSMTLVFDSDLPTDTIEQKGNFKVVFAAQKTEGQNADNYLVEQMEALAASDDVNDEAHARWLVTDDFGLRNRVCNTCEAVVDSNAFANFLKN